MSDFGINIRWHNTGNRNVTRSYVYGAVSQQSVSTFMDIAMSLQSLLERIRMFDKILVQGIHA